MTNMERLGKAMWLCPCAYEWTGILMFEKKLLQHSANGHNWMEKILRAIESQSYKKKINSAKIYLFPTEHPESIFERSGYGLT